MKGAILETRCSAWVDQTPTEEMTKQLELAPGQKLPRRSCGAVVYVWLERPVRCSACGASYEFDAIGRLRPVAGEEMRVKKMPCLFVREFHFGIPWGKEGRE